MRAKRRKRKTEWMTAVAIVFLFEMLITAAAVAVAGSVVLPLAYMERGYWAIGGEWLVLMLVAMAAYTAVHNYLFSRIEEGGKNDAGRNKIACREVSGRRDTAGALRGREGGGRPQARLDYSQRG